MLIGRVVSGHCGAAFASRQLSQAASGRRGRETRCKRDANAVQTRSKRTRSTILSTYSSWYTSSSTSVSTGTSFVTSCSHAHRQHVTRRSKQRHKCQRPRSPPENNVESLDQLPRKALPVRLSAFTWFAADSSQPKL
eukprot:2914-Rhodomonas_salina.1